MWGACQGILRQKKSSGRNGVQDSELEGLEARDDGIVDFVCDD